MKQLDYFFYPRSVAIIGVSKNPKKVGHVIFRNFVEGKFGGKVYPIHPAHDSLFGHRCYPSVLHVKGPVDLAVIAVPAPITPTILEECGKKKIPAVIIVSAGFKEIGNEDLENKLIAIAKKHKMRLVGPNCLGAFVPSSGVDTFFNPKYKMERPGKGTIAFISQSGALGALTMDWMAMKGYSVSKFVSYGNAADVDEADLIEYMGNDSATKVICAYFEGVKEGRKFYETAKKVSMKKPIIALKGGITEAGTKAVSSHTGSLAGAAQIYTAAFKQAGIIQADDLEQILDFARVLSTQPLPHGNRVQIITNGGGFGVLTTDWLVHNGLQLAAMEPATSKKLKKQFPPHYIVANPIDLTGDSTAEVYNLAIQAAIEDPNVDMLCIILLFQVPRLTADVVEYIIEAARKRKKPMIVIAMGGKYTEVLKKTLEDAGIPTYSFPERAATSLKTLYDYALTANKKE